MGGGVRDGICPLGRGGIVKFGFALRRLSLVGPDNPPAEVVFTRGLNVIAGPSDTGKSFIAQCLDYALGGGEVPKAIPEDRLHNCRPGDRVAPRPSGLQT